MNDKQLQAFYLYLSLGQTAVFVGAILIYIGLSTGICSGFFTDENNTTIEVSP